MFIVWHTTGVDCSGDHADETALALDSLEQPTEIFEYHGLIEICGQRTWLGVPECVGEHIAQV